MFSSFPRRREPRIPAPAQTTRKATKCNQMQLNYEFHHSWPLLKRPTKATVASFPASPLGVNEAKQGQMGPRFDPPPGNPLSLWARVSERVVLGEGEDQE